MKLIPKFTPKFIKETRKIDKPLKIQLKKEIQKLLEYPESGKPLRYSFKGLRSKRVGKFRILYELEKNLVIFYAFEHRGKVYK